MAHMAVWKPQAAHFVKALLEAMEQLGDEYYCVLCAGKQRPGLMIQRDPKGIPKGSQRARNDGSKPPVCGDISERFPSVVSDHRRHIHNPTRMMTCVYVYMYTYLYIYIYVYVYMYMYIYICIYEPGPRTPTPPPSPPNGIPPPLLTPPTPPKPSICMLFAHIHTHIHIYILPFPPLQLRISTLFAALESHDLVNGPCLPVYFYHNLFFEPPIACLAHGLQHICYLWITQSLPMQT